MVSGVRGLLCCVQVVVVSTVVFVGGAVSGAMVDAASASTAGRAYERVSPADKNGADVQIAGPARAAADGQRVTFYSFGNFGGGGASGGFRNQMLSRRGTDGWTTHGINPPLDSHGFPGKTGFGYRGPGVADDISRLVSVSETTEPNQGGPAVHLFVYDDATASFAALTRPLVPIASDPFPPTLSSGFGGASRDFGRIVFTSHRDLTASPPLPSENGTSPVYLYEWHDGSLRLISVLPADEGGAPALASVQAGAGSQMVENRYAGDRPVSQDGSRVFWSTVDSGAVPVANPSLYQWRDPDLDGPAPATTVLVNRSERTVPDQRSEPSFDLASADGRIAVFTSREKLTDDSQACGACGGHGASGESADLYRWDADAPAGERLVDLTPIPGGGDVPNKTSADGSTVSSAIGSSVDAARIYFVAYGDLAPGAVDDEPNVYLWQEGVGIRHVAALDGSPGPMPPAPADIAVWTRDLNTGDASPRFRDARVSPDGRYLLVRSRAQLTDYDTAGTYQVYRYDAVDDELECASCNRRSSHSSADAYLKRSPPDDRSPPWYQRNLSDDGHRVFFDSAEALVPEDTNGRIDVYEWSDGDVRLVSSGRSGEDSAFVDASASGDDVFFTTRQSLVDSDTDSLVDLYDARIGGGFAHPLLVFPCVDDACQGAPSGRPQLSSPGSSGLSAPGDAAPGPRASFRVLRLSRSQRIALARGRAVALRISVNRGGKLSVAARAKLGKRTRMVAKAAKRARTAGTVRLRLRLSATARRYLARSGRMRVTLSVRLSGAAEPRRAAVVLTRAVADTTRRSSQRRRAAARLNGKAR